MTEPRHFELSEQDLVVLAQCFYKLKPLFDLALSSDDTAGICALESCRLPFIKREAKQIYCCPAHQQKASNDARVRRKTNMLVSAPTTPIKCQVVGCDNVFTFDPLVPFPYRCRECASKST